MSARSPKRSGGAREYKKKRTESFNLYIFKVLKQVHPEIGMSKRAMNVMNGFVHDTFDRIANEADNIVRCNQVLIGPNTVISSVVGRFTAGPDTDHEVANPVTLGHRVWVGANVRIAAGVSIGDNCVIGAGSLVTESLPANTLAYGIPAARIRKIQQNPQ